MHFVPPRYGFPKEFLPSGLGARQRLIDRYKILSQYLAKRIMMTQFPDISLWEAALMEKYRQRELQRQRILANTIEALKEYFCRKRVRKVYLAGSILQEGKYFAFSDLDIAVEGLEEDYFVTLVELEELLDRNVDLIELESCRFRWKIQEKGVKIQ